MKAIIRASIWLSLCSFIATVHASSLEVNTYNNIAYFADDQSTSVKRYSLADEKFLTPIILTANPKAVHIDSTGIYVSYGTKIFKLSLDGTNPILFRETTEAIYDLVSTDTYLIMAATSYLQNANKINNSPLDNITYYSVFIPDITITPDNSQLFFTTKGYSPADIYKVSLTSTGVMGTATDSPYHADYLVGPNPTVFPTKKRVVDSSGNVYNTMDLAHIGSIGGAYKDIGFWEGIPIVLRGNALYSYNQNLEQTGVYNLPQGSTAEKISIYGDSAFVFGLNNGNLTASKYKVALTSANATTVTINPTDLAYTPDALVLDKDQDTLYILSKANLAIFRWSVSKAAYIKSLPLDNSPHQMTYSPDHQRIYLSYYDGTINYIDLNSTDTSEHPFINEHSYPYTMTATGPFIAIKDASGLAGSFKIFTKEGIKTDTREWITYNSDAVWDDNYKRIYYIYPDSDFNWLQLDTNTGTLGVIQNYRSVTSLYLDIYGWAGPMRVSQNGKIIAFASGRVLEKKSLKELADIQTSGALKDMAWLQGNLFTIKGVDSNTYTQLERWQANFSRDVSATYEIQGVPLGLIPLTSAGKLVFIYSRDGQPIFEIRSYAAKDFDNDGHLDADDALPTNPNEWLDFDDDGLGNNSDTDDDSDGVADTQDAFPLNPKETLDTDKDGIGNNEDTDDDGDGVLDYEDVFSLNPSETKDFDFDGIGDNSDPDIDNDNVPNSSDSFPRNRLEWIDTDKDGIGNNADTDDDNDGTPDDQDSFPLNPLESKDMDNDGSGDNSDPDIDGDGVLNASDAFPLDRNEYLDTDKDGIGNNTDTDDDSDGVLDLQDAFPLNPLESNDMDNDGIGDNSDIDIDGDDVLNISDPFPLDRNESLDTDKDGIGNNADTDDDNDGVRDTNDIWPLDPKESKDLDHDGIGDNSDPDIDGDGVLNAKDPDPLEPTESLDTDEDGIGNKADLDDDNDGVADSSDYYSTDASRSVLKAADFFPARKGSNWLFDFSNQPVVLHTEVSIAGKSILPFTFPGGYKLYLVGSGDQIQLLGFNLPTKDDGGASFTLDITLNTAINLTSNSSRSGNGNINITPTYGNRDLNWSATTQYLGSETVIVPAGRYSALHTRVDFSGTASIDGKNATITYYADIWFAENVGIVKMNDNGQLINLVSVTFPAPQPSSNGGGITSGGSSSGGSTSGQSSGGNSGGGGGSIGWLTLALLLAFCSPGLRTGTRNTDKAC